MTENLAETIDKDSLISLLKEKGKEIKGLENKNKKLEERYIKVFRDNKNLVKDKETFEKFLTVVFNQDQEKFKSGEGSTYDIGILTDTWNQRQNGSQQSNEKVETYKSKISQLEAKNTSLEEELTKSRNISNPEIDKMVESYKSRIGGLEKANEKLNKEIRDLNEIIEGRNEEIANLKNVEYELDSLKAELLMKELQIKNVNEGLNLKTKMQENERKNEILRLRQEVDCAHATIKALEAEKETSQTLRTNSVKSEGVQTEIQQEVLDAGLNNLADPSPRVSSHDSLQKPTFGRKDSDSYSTNFSEGGLMNQEYFKNVIVKLFCYIEGNNLSEAKALMNAIGIMLKMTPDDRAKIEESKQNNTIWTSTVHFLKDTFSTKGEVNYYTNPAQAAKR